MSAMCRGRLDRFVPVVERSASRSIELMSPTSSRRLARRSERKYSRSFRPQPAWFLRGLPSVVTGNGGGGGGVALASALRRDLAESLRRAGFAAAAAIAIDLPGGRAAGVAMIRPGPALITSAGGPAA